MKIYTLVSSLNKDVLFNADKREGDLKIYNEALKVDVGFNKETGKAEIYA